jgi:tetratricopeptide (TPR) repeat protein
MHRSAAIAPKAGTPRIPHASSRPAARTAVVGTLLLVVSLVAAAHWPVLGARAISLDDNAFIKNNPLVTSPGWNSTSRFFREVLRPSTVEGYYLPLSMTSLMVDYALGGRSDDLRVFHRTNLVLHLLTTALLVLLLYRLFGALVPAALAGLLFGLHPLTVEPVAWVAERKTLLASCFALASLLAHVESHRGRTRTWTIVALACFALALLSKPTVIMLPVLMLLLDVWPLRRAGLRAALQKWPFFALSAVFAAITLVSHGRSATVAPLTRADVLDWPMRAGYLLAFYLGKIVAPVGLTCVYAPPKPFALSNPAVALSLAFLVAVFAGLLFAARRSRGPLVSAAFFVLAIVPTLGLVQYSWVIASDKYVYFPATGLMLAVTAGIAALGAGRHRNAWLPLVAISLLALLGLEAYGVRTTLRQWKDTPTLVRHMARLAPDAPAVVNYQALLELAGARPDASLPLLRRAVALAPGFGDAQYNLGILLAGRGEMKAAIEHLRMACALLPNDADALGALGATLRASGQPDEGIPYLRRSLALAPEFQSVLVQLGESLVARGELAEGITLMRRAVAQSPEDPALRYELSAALLQVRGGTADAVVQLRRVIDLKPDWAEPLNTLAWVLATNADSDVRNPAEARRLATRAVELTAGRRPETFDTLAAALAAGGDFGEAARVAGRAAEMARRGNANALAGEISARMALYRKGLAYTEPAAAEPAPPS